MENIFGSVINTYTVEDGLADGEFIDITKSVKGILKWQTIISKSLHNKIKALNGSDNEIDTIYKDLATMFTYKAKFTDNNGSDILDFKCILKANLKDKEDIIWAAINFDKKENPIMTFFFPQEYWGSW